MSGFGNLYFCKYCSRLLEVLSLQTKTRDDDLRVIAGEYGCLPWQMLELHPAVWQLADCPLLMGGGNLRGIHHTNRTAPIMYPSIIHTQMDFIENFSMLSSAPSHFQTFFLYHGSHRRDCTIRGKFFITLHPSNTLGREEVSSYRILNSLQTTVK